MKKKTKQKQDSKAFFIVLVIVLGLFLIKTLSKVQMDVNTSPKYLNILSSYENADLE